MSAFVKETEVRQEEFDWGTIGWRCVPANTGSQHLPVAANFFSLKDSAGIENSALPNVPSDTGLRATSLGLVNRGDGTLESRSNTIVMRHLGNAWRASRPGGGG